MVARHFGLAFSGLFFLSAAANAAEVRLRVVYLNDGKPAKGQLISLTLGDPQKNSSPIESATTDPDGVALFSLSDPSPLVVWVDEDNGRIEGCAKSEVIPLEAVMKLGVTIGVDERFGRSCKGDRSAIEQLKAKPGEIVVFVRKLTIWDSLRRY